MSATGGTGGYTWSVSTGSLPAGLSLATTGTISGTPTAPGTASFTVQVTDSANTSTTKPLSIAVAPAALNITTSSLPGGTVGASYSQGLSATGGTGGYTWSVSTGSLPAGLSLSATGTIGGTPTAPGTASFTVKVTDSANTSTTKPLSIAVAPAGPEHQYLILTRRHRRRFLLAGPLRNRRNRRLHLVRQHRQPSHRTLPVRYRHHQRNTDRPRHRQLHRQGHRQRQHLHHQAPEHRSRPGGPQHQTSSLPGGTVGASYSQGLSATGGTGGYTWSVSTGSLPTGLSLSATGTISGTPTAPGTASFTVQVTDSANTSTTKPLSIAVAPAGLNISTSSLPGGTVGASYSQGLSATGGTGGYTWSISSGSLPAGLSLAGGTIGGTPTAPGTASFTVKVTDSANTSTTKPLSIAVAPAGLNISTSSLPGGTVGASYSQGLSATGGTGGYTWSVSTGSLPAGLSLRPPELSAVPRPPPAPPASPSRSPIAPTPPPPSP